MYKLTKFIMGDLIRNRVIFLYMIFLMASCIGLFMLEGQEDKAITGILNLMLLTVPLVTLLFATIYYYNMYEFMVLMLSQPIKRSTVISSVYLSLGFSFSLAILLGIGLPIVFFNVKWLGIMLAFIGIFLSWIFVGVAIFLGVYTRDKSKGMGAALLVWAYFVLIFDGIVLLLMYNFSDYPIEKLVLFITFLNPIDLSRILVLMQTEAAALMGYSGAVFRQFFNSTCGNLVSFGILLIWACIPLIISLRKFQKKDL